MANKEAIVFIVDANLTMNAPYPSHHSEDSVKNNGSKNESSSSSSSNTRLSQAKDAVLTSIIDLMWRSKTHETGVVVLKAGITHHHLSEIERITDDVDVGKFFRRCRGGYKLERYENDNEDDENEEDEGDVFPNLVEFDLNRPSPQTLRAINHVQCTINESIASSVQGDLCDGLILAADALHRRTNNKKYKRKIVMITDAEHEVEVNGEQLQCVLDGLNKMEVELIVIGIGFQENIVIPIKDEEEEEDTRVDDDNNIGDKKQEAIDIDSDDDNNNNNDLDKKPEAVVSMKEEGNDIIGEEMTIKEEGNPDEMTLDNDSKKDIGQLIKRENEKLLASIARETKGCILAANGVNLSELLQTKLPCLAGTKKSAPRKIEFRIAPNLTLTVKSGKLTDKLNIPTTVKEAYQIDPETGKKLRDGLGELMTLPTRTDTRHYLDEEDGNEVEVPFDKRTDAFRYGADLIPVGKMDMLGINAAFADPGSIEMIGYIDRKEVESSNLLMGPAYAFTGGDSKKAKTAIAALAQALEETNKVGFCRIVRTKNGDPKIGALLPKMCSDPEGKGGRYLAFLEMPFADDIQHHKPIPVPLDYHGDYKDEKVCDDLIDSMMLPDDEFQSEDVSFPALKAYQRMVAHFATNPLPPEEEMQQEGLPPDRIIEASQAKPLCDLDVVKSVSKKASKHVDAFTKTFPLVEHKPEDGKKRKFWGDGNQ